MPTTAASDDAPLDSRDSGRPALAFVVVDGSADAVAAHLESVAPAGVGFVVIDAADVDGLARSRARLAVFVTDRDRFDTELLRELARRRLRKAIRVPCPDPHFRPSHVQAAELAIATTGTGFPLRTAVESLRGTPCRDAVVLRARAVASGVVVALVRAPVAVVESESRGPLEDGEELVARFTELADVTVHDVDARDAIRHTREAIVRQIGELVRDNLELRSQFIDLVRPAVPLGFDLQAMNAASATTLAIAYAFPPYLDTSGFVTARRFALEGRPYDVVTQAMDAHRPIDERSMLLAAEELGRHMVVPGRAAFGSWVTIEKFCRRGMELIEAREREAGQYERIYTRSMWAASTVLGAWYKALHPEVPWIAELSDPLTQRPNGERRPNPFPPNDILDAIEQAAAELGRPQWHGEGFFEAVEWMAYALADEIIFTNENQRDFMLADFYDKDLAKRALSVSRVSHHPVPPASMYELAAPSDALPVGPVTIAYFGRFYAVRGVEDLLNPFGALTPAERERLRLVIFTTDLEETREAVASHPASDCVEIHDALPYFEFLATAKAADWLLLADAHRPAEFSVNPYLPSKLADYLGSGTPVWALAEPGSVLSREPVAAMSPLGDVEAAARVLRTQILAD